MKVSQAGEKREGFPYYWQVAVLFAAALLIFSRDPSALFHAQFYAEDGRVWFADAYNSGPLRSLFSPYTGYFQTLPRLAAAIALLGPLKSAPLVMNLVGFLIQLLPVPILLSRRLSTFGALPFRAVLAFVYLALPNSREVNVTVTEAQWHLALAACLLLLAKAPRTRLERIFDFGIYMLCGATGPFCVFLLPLTLFSSRLHPRDWRWNPVIVLACAAVTQLGALLFSHSLRPSSLPLGASLAGAVRILGGQVYLGTILGSNSFGRWGDFKTLAILAVLGTALFVYIAVRARTPFRLLVIFAMVLFVASMANPMLGPPGSAKTAWEGLAGSAAIHYWFLPALAFSWGVIWLVCGPTRTQLSQAIGVLMVPLMLVGVVRDWRYSAYGDVRFAEYVDKLTVGKSGEAVVIPETPPGWDLRLIRR